MDLIRKTARRAFLVLPLLAAVSLPFKWKLFPLSILVGGALALVNMRGLARGVEAFFGGQKASGLMIFFSMFRLLILFITLILLVSLRLVNIFGILVGLTTVFFLLLIEGYRIAKADDETAGP